MLIDLREVICFLYIMMVLNKILLFYVSHKFWSLLQSVSEKKFKKGMSFETSWTPKLTSYEGALVII